MSNALWTVVEVVKESFNRLPTNLWSIYCLSIIFVLLFKIRTFLFLEDQQIELEYWAETGELGSTELCQMKVRFVLSLKHERI